MENLTDEEFIYLYCDLTNADKKLPKNIYQKFIHGDDFTKEEEQIIKQVIKKDKSK